MISDRVPAAASAAAARLSGRPIDTARSPIGCVGARPLETARRQFARLRDVNPATDYDNWLVQMTSADAAISQMIACSPADGLLWALRAVLLRQAVSSPDRVVEALMLSRRLSPAHASAVIARAATWWSLPVDLALEPAAKAARDADIALFVDQAKPLLVARFLRESPEAIRAEIRRLYNGASSGRREALDYAIRISEPERPARDTSPGSPDTSLFDFLNQRPQFD